MVEMMKNIIQDKQMKEGNTNGTAWKRFVFTIGGKTISSFDASNDEFKVGDYVEVAFNSQPAKDNPAVIYNNMVSMKKAEGTPPAPVPMAAPAKANSYGRYYAAEEASRNASILLSYAVTSVRDLAVAGKIELKDLATNIETLSEDIVKIYKKRRFQLLEEEPKELDPNDLANAEKIA